jgi:hypothetical protein
MALYTNNVQLQEVDGNGNAEMTPCDGTATSAKWCCGTHNTACCGTAQEIVLAAVLGAATTSSSTSKTSSATSISTTASQSSKTSSPTPNPTSAAAPPSALSTGAKAGIGIGCAALAVLVAGAIFYFFKRKKSSQAASLAAECATGSYPDERKFELHGMPQQQLLEMQGDGVMVRSRGSPGDDGRMTELP